MRSWLTPPIEDEEEARAWILDHDGGLLNGGRSPRQGIASRCVELATEWLFGAQELMPADEIELLHTVGNEGSCRVAEKCGFVLDSILTPLPPKFPEAAHRHLRKHPE